ncbi:hypothetical protein [Streptomyces sp. NPDC095817]
MAAIDSRMHVEGRRTSTLIASVYGMNFNHIPELPGHGGTRSPSR